MWEERQQAGWDTDVCCSLGAKMISSSFPLTRKRRREENRCCKKEINYYLVKSEYEGFFYGKADHNSISYNPNPAQTVDFCGLLPRWFYRDITTLSNCSSVITMTRWKRNPQLCETTSPHHEEKTHYRPFHSLILTWALITPTHTMPYVPQYTFSFYGHVVW